jgi:hypothetical protein
MVMKPEKKHLPDEEPKKECIDVLLWDAKVNQ